MRRSLVILALIVSSLLLVGAVGAQQNPNAFPFTTTTDPASLIGSYYSAITLHDYGRAYSYWETPPHNQTLAQFTAGFSDTASATALVAVPYLTDAGAGNVYASLPAVVVAQRTNGTQVYYAGCFAAHKSNVPVGNATEPDPNWTLRSANLVQVTTAYAAIARMTTACQTP
ncbi:MAG: hypothetical protein JNL34_07570 [Anaerolineae bacterium]|nr:hypothetical protein [Anaerolineae bacterium]